MTLPDNELSSTPKLAPFLASSSYPSTDSVSYTYGPKGIQDPSEGLTYQSWRARLIQGNISLAAPNTTEYVFTYVRCATQISLAFDQNARPLVTYLVGTSLYIYWFNPFIAQYEHRYIDDGVSSCRLKLDDERLSQISSSQVILGYVKGDNLYMRVQSDRFEIPYLIQEGVQPRLIQIGLSRANRFQFLFEQNPFPVYEDPYPPGTI